MIVGLCVLGILGTILAIAALPGAVQPWISYRLDLDVYRLGAQALLTGDPLYGDLLPTLKGHDLPFTYPPFAAVVFIPLALIPYWLANVGFTLLSLVGLYLAVRLVLGEAGPRTATRSVQPWLLLPALAAALIAVPVLETIRLGQVNLILMALILIDVIVGRGRPWQGVATGIAAAIKLTPLVFLAYFALARNWRACAVGLGTTLLATALGFGLAPRDSFDYWTRAVLDPDRIGPLEYVSNQSLNGALLRFGVSDTAVPWVVACLLLGLLVLYVAHRLIRNDAHLEAVLALAVYALLASPVSWTHHWVWIVPCFVVSASRGYTLERRWMVGVGIAGIAAYWLWVLRLALERSIPALASPGWRHLLANAQALWGLAFLFVLATPLRRMGETEESAIVHMAAPTS